jgi:hypothetical protein
MASALLWRFAFEYDRAGTVLALARQYSRSHVRMALRGEEFETFIRAVYYLLNSIAHQTSLEIREFTLPGPGPC